jgi:hypothetical protein
MDEFADKGVSRRSALKRIGAGAAIAWTAPVLTSIRTPAFAQTTACASGCPECQFGAPCLNCGACVGIPTECVCADTGICTAPDPICSSDADCEAQCGGPARCAPCVFDPSCVKTSCWCLCPRGQLRIPKGPGTRVIRYSR